MKTVKAIVSISTDPRVQGRYFVDVRDTTNGAYRQMTTRTTDDPAAFIRELTTKGVEHGVWVDFEDETGDMA